jgi:hypothetical protein
MSDKAKIEKYRSLKSKLEDNLNRVKMCQGYTYSKDKTYEYNSSIDKKNFKFTTNRSDYRKPIYLDAYYGYYGNSSTYSFTDDFYMQCMTEAMNKNMNIIMKDTEDIMVNECNKALLAAKEEAISIIKEVEELGLCE